MTNFVVVFDEVKKLLDSISRVSNPKAVTKIAMGASEVGEDVACAAKVLGGTEEVSVKFLAKKPKDFDGAPSQVAVENTKLVSILTGLSMIKESISFGFGDALMLGIPNKAMTSIPVIGEDEIPAGVALDKNAQITRFYAEQSKMIDLLKGGGFATANNDQTGRGLANATLVVYDDKLTLFSVNETGSTLGYSECPADVKDIATENGSNKRLDFCKANGLKEFVVPIPKKVIVNLLGMLDGQGKCSFIITDKVLLCAPNDSTQYLAVLGAKSFTGGLNLIEKVGALPIKGTVVVDNEKIMANLSLIQTFISNTDKKNVPISLKFGKEKLMISQTNGDGKVVIDLVGSSFEAPEEKLLDAERVAKVIGILGKGNVRIDVRDGESTPLAFANGSLSEIAGLTKAYLAPVKMQVEKDESTTAETSEATE